MKALLISSCGEEKFAPILRDSGFDEVLRVSAREALLAPDDCALILLNAIKGDGQTLKLAEELTRRTRAAVLLLVPEAEVSALAPEASRLGAFLLGKPLARALLLASAQNAIALFQRVGAAREEARRLREKLYEAKAVNRAKIALVKYLNMSEKQAHRYIEKQAMDRRVTKLDVAMSIIANYDV